MAPSHAPLVAVHRASTLSQCAERLNGFDRQCLPKSIGGEWGVERFVEWQELRTRWEWDLPPAAGHRNVDLIFDFTQIKLSSELSPVDRAERRRRANVLHSRRKRERERIEHEVLDEQCKAIKESIARGKKEENRLTALLTAAQRVLATLEVAPVPFHSRSLSLRNQHFQWRHASVLAQHRALAHSAMLNNMQLQSTLLHSQQHLPPHMNPNLLLGPSLAAGIAANVGQQSNVQIARFDSGVDKGRKRIQDSQGRVLQDYDGRLT